MNSEIRRPDLPLWPFIVLDLLFLALAFVMFKSVSRPLGVWEGAEIILCAAGAAVCFALPYLRRNANEVALAQTDAVADAINEIKKLDGLAQQIHLVTNQWNGMQEQATKTVDSAREVADGMAAEAKSFVEFLKKANENEKAHLRVEVDKLRRGEGQWLEVVVRIMDNVYALNQAAIQSGKANLINQIGQFQKNCLESARRVGLVPVVPESGAVYDAKTHDLFEGEKARDNAKITQIVSCGYTFQSQVIRKPVVLLQAEKRSEPNAAAQNILPGLAS